MSGPKRFIDRHGNTVEPAVVDGHAVFIPRDKHGYVLGRSMGDGRKDPTTVEQLSALGVDIGSLREA